jgi:cation transport regulator ChaC
MATESSLLNFAYGSNMLASRLRERVPSATLVGVAYLPGHALRWHKISADDSGKCDVVVDNSPGARVWGVLYEIALAEKRDLDRAEGLGSGYAERNVAVVMKGERLEAHLYYATTIDPQATPYEWYKAIVVAGAKENGLPLEYIASLEAAVAKRDSNAERTCKHLALLPGNR